MLVITEISLKLFEYFYTASQEKKTLGPEIVKVLEITKKFPLFVEVGSPSPVISHTNIQMILRKFWVITTYS